MKQTIKKLKLNKESIRLLDSDQISEAIGGAITGVNCTDVNCQSFTCPSWTCATGYSRCQRTCLC